MISEEIVMPYTFEDLPTSKPNTLACKVLLNGQQVAVMEHLSHHMQFDGNQRDWRVFRLSDRKQVQPWKVITELTLEKAQRLVQDIPSSTFDDIESREWTVVVHTVYGYRYFLGVSEDYPSLEKMPRLQTMADAGRSFDEIVKNRSIYMPSQGDALARVELVNYTNLKEVVRVRDLTPL
jgi:hypothetical protein